MDGRLNKTIHACLVGSSGNHIRTLSSEPAVSIHSIINLEVALLLRQSLID